MLLIHSPEVNEYQKHWTEPTPKGILIFFILNSDIDRI